MRFKLPLHALTMRKHNCVEEMLLSTGKKLNQKDIIYQENQGAFKIQTIINYRDNQNYI